MKNRHGNTIAHQPHKNIPYGNLPQAYVPPEQQDMMPTQRPPNCPPGLEYLNMIDQLLVQQEVELVEAIFGVETNNKYMVRNTMGQQVFYVTEENNCCNRQCLGPSRSFVLHVQDNNDQEVMTLQRPLRCSLGCFPICLQELEVQAPFGNTIGYVIQEWDLLFPKFTIQNEKRESILKIRGPFCPWRCCPDVDFEVLSLDEQTKVGNISKQWAGLMQEAFTDADNFGIKFPMDLDVKAKAILLGACFLIDFMFFEKTD
ncbi:phospholipid scramblase 1-like [Engraulis encrasicolus]|uniref:phospholipid scramblase 1-like n=1 Tax=Engraulis encrasicolus TaxID=184585 RepID=UPI002FD74B02